MLRHSLHFFAAKINPSLLFLVSVIDVWICTQYYQLAIRRLVIQYVLFFLCVHVFCLFEFLFFETQVTLYSLG